MAQRTPTNSGNSERISPEKLAELMGHLGGADTVELKVTVPLSGHAATIKSLGLDPVEAEPRQIYFFDTPRLDLNGAGIVVRARRSRGGVADTVIKLRPVVPADLPKRLRRSGAFKVEVDALPSGFVCSASLKGQATGAEVNDAVSGDAALKTLFSKEQRTFFAEHAPKGLSLDKLAPLGPTFVLKSRFYVKSLDRRVGAEMWLYPDGTRILELSTKAMPIEAFQVAAAFRTYLANKGIEVGTVQETKTKTALDYFSTRLPGRSAQQAAARRLRDRR